MADLVRVEAAAGAALGKDPTVVDDDEPMFGDDPEVPDELNPDRCQECGAWPEDYHEMDCSRGDDDDIEDDENEDVEDFA